MDSYYDTMQVCSKCGRKITDCYNTYPAHRQEFCDVCGGKTIHKCPNCQTDIRGYYHVSGVVGGSGPSVPLNCHKCGKPYIWRSRVIKRIKLNSCRWNYFNPFWLLYKLLILAWDYKIITGIIIALIAGFLIWKLGWK